MSPLPLVYKNYDRDMDWERLESTLTSTLDLSMIDHHRWMLVSLINE